jgi:ATP-dependent Zn protease
MSWLVTIRDKGAFIRALGEYVFLSNRERTLCNRMRRVTPAAVVGANAAAEEIVTSL